MGSASPFLAGASSFKLPPGTTAYRKPVILGRAVAIFFSMQPPTSWDWHAYPWFKIAVQLGMADSDLEYRDKTDVRSVTMTGEYVCFIGAGEVHSVRWKHEAPMVWILIAKEYLQQLGMSHLSGITCVEMVRLFRQDLSIYRLISLFHEACVANEKIVQLYVEAKATLLAACRT